jgi:hypothetical protein
MLPNDTRSKLENIVSGNVLEGPKDTCTTIRNWLCSRFATSGVVKAKFESNAIIKEEQAELIEVFCNTHSVWATEITASSNYLTRGGED